jgi:hypothetical protein
VFGAFSLECVIKQSGIIVWLLSVEMVLSEFVEGVVVVV